jgi:hypothetical protein
VSQEPPGQEEQKLAKQCRFNAREQAGAFLFAVAPMVLLGQHQARLSSISHSTNPPWQPLNEFPGNVG